MLTRYKVILTSLFSLIHDLHAARIEKRLLALEIQEELIIRIGKSERSIRKSKSALKNLKSKLSIKGNSKEDSRLIKLRCKTIENNIERQKLLLWVFRTVGDSVAFIYGDKWDLKNYALKDDSGFITDKKGSRLERKLLRYAFQKGGTAVLNDLTNSLRHADLTVFRPDLWPDGNSPFMLVEAKSGKGGNKARLMRQKESAEKITKYVMTDKREEDNGIWRRVEAKNESQHHFETVKSLIINLPKGGHLVKEVEPGLIYLIADCNTDDFNAEKLLSPIFDITNNYLFISVNDLKQQCWGYYLFPLCFLDPNSLFRFYNGEYVFWVFVNMDKVNEMASESKIIVQHSDKVGFTWKLVPEGVNNPEEHEISYVGFHIIGRLAAEFLSLSWIIQNIVCFPMKKEMEQMSPEHVSPQNNSIETRADTL